jgi:cupredoxin-like protein
LRSCPAVNWLAGRQSRRYVASDYQLQSNPSRMRRVFVATLALAIWSGPSLADGAPITLAIHDNQFVPAEVPVPAGVKVELIVRNERAVPSEFESTSLHREKIVPPGGQASVFIGPLNPGRYDIFDDFNPTTRGFVVVR